MVFYSGIKDSSCISGEQERCDRLFDNMHSSGTSFIGYIFALCIGIYIGFNSITFNIKTILLFVLLIIHAIEYCLARKNALCFLKAILINKLNNIQNTEKKALVIFIANEDILTSKSWHYLYKCFKKIRIKRQMLKINYSKKLSVYQLKD